MTSASARFPAVPSRSGSDSVPPRSHFTSARPLTYRYQAVDGRGTAVSGTVRAADAADAAEQLRMRGFLPVRLAPRMLPTPRRSPGAGEIAAALRILGSLLEAGLPLGRALAAFEDLAPPAWRAALPAMRERLRRGAPFEVEVAEALCVPPVAAAILAAGEAAGTLPEAIRRAVGVLEHGVALRRASRGALVYPAILLATALSVAALLARVALGVSRVELGVAGVVVVLAWAAGVAWGRTARGRWVRCRVLLAVPGVGAVRHAAASSRVCLALAALLDSGVPIGAAMTCAADAAEDPAVADRVRAARDAVVAGARMSVAMRRAGAVTPSALRSIAAGEAEGSPERLARRCAQAARREASRATAVRGTE